MTITTPGLPAALQGLAQALDSSGGTEVGVEEGQARVRRALAAVRTALVAESGTDAEGWTAARESVVLRERTTILARIDALTAAEGLEHAEVRRLLTDVTHHAQRLSDLAYDEVELELGGSE